MQGKILSSVPPETTFISRNCFSGSNVGITLSVLEQLHFVMKQQWKEGSGHADFNICSKQDPLPP